LSAGRTVPRLATDAMTDRDAAVSPDQAGGCGGKSLMGR